MPFLSNQNKWPPTLIFPKSIDHNFDLAILFNIVENLITMSLRMIYSPTVPGERAANCEKLCPLFTYSIGYWKIYRRFQRELFLAVEGGGVWLGKKGYVGESFLGEIFHAGREFPMKRKFFSMGDRTDRMVIEFCKTAYSNGN